MNINNPTTFSSPALVYSTSNSSGTAGSLRADDTLAIFSSQTPTVIAYGASASTGDNAFVSREDHVHGMPAADALTSKLLTGSRSAAAGAGDQVIEEVGFSPLAAISLGDGGTYGEVASWGFSDSAAAEAAEGSRNTGTFVLTSKFMTFDDGATNNMQAVLKSYDEDGITLTWTKGGSGDDVTYAILFLGKG